MPNITGGEIVIILLVALIVLGPQRLPEAARQVSKAFREFRRVQNTVQSEIRATLDAAGEPIRETTKPVTQTVDVLRTGGTAPAAQADGDPPAESATEPATEPVPDSPNGADPAAGAAETPTATPATTSTATFRPRENGAGHPGPAVDWGEAPLHDDP
jgi:sec-independent protein translocase protein TatB